MPAALADRQAGQLANGREVVGLDKFHGRQLRVELPVLPTDRQVAFGEVQVAHLACATGGGTEADTTGVGKQVEHAFVLAVILDPAAGVAQVEEQQRVLSGMATAHPIVQAPFVADQVLQGGFVGAVDDVIAIDARVAAGAVVVDQQGFKTQVLIDRFVQLQQRLALQRLVETLHQQLRAVAVDGQATGTFLATVEEAIAIGALQVQFGEQVLALIEGGAQRLIQGRHAGRLAGGNWAREFNSFGAGPRRCLREQARSHIGFSVNVKLAIDIDPVWERACSRSF
ncbi:hypothetical protein EMIT0P43_90029 [Pseudomonas jessenii]